MRLLAQPDVLRGAGMAAAVSALLCFPRLQAWKADEMLLFAVLMLLWCQFVLWAFVFAWEPSYGTADTFVIRSEPRWFLLCAGAVLVACYQFFLIDPEYRQVAPKAYPHSFGAWWRQLMFSLAFWELFLCYGPLAFFARLIRNPRWVLTLTVAFNVFIVGIKLFSVPESIGAFTTVAILLHRVVIAYLAVRLYRWSGICAVSLLVLITQSRHLLRIDF